MSMTDYKELEVKVAETQQEIERLKKKEEERKNGLPEYFNRESAIELLKIVDNRRYSDYLEYLDDAFLWGGSPQGWQYWADKCEDLNLFKKKDYIQVQKWIILSYQQEVK